MRWSFPAKRFSLKAIKRSSSPSKPIARWREDRWSSARVFAKTSKFSKASTPERWSFAPLRWFYRLAKDDHFSGEDPASPHYWGDLARQRIRYVNQFTFEDINLLNVTPSFPYRLPDKPLVNRWFPTANGDNLDQFERLLSPENLDRLEREGGVSIVYAHLGAGSFNAGDGVDPRFEARIRDVASRNGWFVPASKLLDYLATQPGWRADPGWRERVRLEIEKLLAKGSLWHLG